MKEKKKSLSQPVAKQMLLGKLMLCLLSDVPSMCEIPIIMTHVVLPILPPSAPLSKSLKTKQKKYGQEHELKKIKS